MSVLGQKIIAAAKRYDLDPKILEALVMQESAGDTWAVRYEPRWSTFLNIKYWANRVKISQPTERICQAMSFGLTQVMGTVARELGHKGDLTQLCDPDIGLDLGAKKLRQLLDRHGQDYDKALSAYNTGRPDSNHGRKYALMVKSRINGSNSTV